MNFRTFFLLLFVVAKTNISFSQSCPDNIDFEKGDFTNWDCFIGDTYVKNNKNVISLTPSKPIAGRHEIISASSSTQLDPYGKFPTLCPYGGKYSVKLGNNDIDAEAEGLSYTFKVPATEDTFSFTYFYAVVFEDPGHYDYEQPRFFVTAYEVATGNLINCASYNYVSNGSIPGFQKSNLNPGVLYKKWTPSSIQFVGLADKMVRLEFKTADCTKGAHFGYAYVDVGSGCSNILATAPYCKETNSLILNAPYGFKSYIWYNEDFTKVIGDSQSITLKPPPLVNKKFYVDLIPYPGYGCRDTVYALVTPQPVPDTPAAKTDYFYCQSQNASALTGTPLPNCDLIWYNADTTVAGSNIPPKPTTTSPGEAIFYVSQKVLLGCESFRKKIVVEVDPVPVPSFIINKNAQCQETNKFIFTSTSGNLKNTTYSWDLGDGTIINSDDLFASHSYKTYGSFPVKLTVLNQPVCFKEISQQVKVIPTPIAGFTYPSLICQQETPVILKDNSSVPSQLTNITNWWWNINGKISKAQNPNTFLASIGGKLPVKLVVTTPEGCTSDTNALELTVRYQPEALFNISDLVCNNEIIHFTDKSLIATSGTGENVIKWFWQLDNNTASLQNPLAQLASGTHTAKLIVQSNYGCNSTEKDSIFTVYSKPHIALNINDSCVWRTINYKATDSLNIAGKWLWNFGNGMSQMNSTVTRSYSNEQKIQITVIAETIHSCKDTIVSRFVIYDNKALAGHDTLVAMDQPVQLMAHGGSNVTYKWSPSEGLNNASIENPVAILDRDQLYRLDAITDKGCDSHSRILIKRFKGPEIYIPTAFTPNRDGLNDVLKAFPIGIKKFNFLAVYNRYGQRLFYTENALEGWNGYVNGQPADGGVYVAMAKAIDYMGREMLKKVSVVLIH